MLWVRRLCALAVVCLPFAALGGRAGSLLASAEAAYDDLAFEKSRTLAREALEAGDGDPAVLWRLHALMGKSLAALGYPAEAATAFLRALELNPALELDPTDSPKVLEPYKRARAQAPPPLAARPSTTHSEGSLHLTLAVLGDTEHLVQSCRVLLRGRMEPLRAQRVGPDAFTANASCDTPCDYHAELLDAHGNLIMRVGSAASPLRALPPPVAGPAWFQQQRTWWLAASGASIASAAVFFLQRNSQEAQLEEITTNRDLHLYGELVDQQAARDRNHLLMLGSLGLSAITSALAVWTW